MGGVTKCQAMIQKINEGLLDPLSAEQDICLLNEDVVTLGIEDFPKKAKPSVIHNPNTIHQKVERIG